MRECASVHAHSVCKENVRREAGDFLYGDEFGTSSRATRFGSVVFDRFRGELRHRLSRCDGCCVYAAAGRSTPCSALRIKFSWQCDTGSCGSCIASPRCCRGAACAVMGLAPSIFQCLPHGRPQWGAFPRGRATCARRVVCARPRWHRVHLLLVCVLCMGVLPNLARSAVAAGSPVDEGGSSRCLPTWPEFVVCPCVPRSPGQAW